jgi:alanyl-tRNA synthetase
MNAKQIRQTFLDFFVKKGHQIVPSAPLVVKDDPTLMFNNAGMNQFKDYFLGNKEAKNKRVADTQKCLRVSGKHNDLEEVGIDTYHHTLFEMLGNWSFGDYFKEETIDWAWELLTEVYGLPKDRLYATVFEGDKADNLPADTESYNLWKKHIPEEQILYCDKKDNFWEMGETGPCGGCSELHIDLRPESERQKVSGRSLVNQDDPQVIEIWNLVFMEFNRMANRSLEPLPDKHVDTGMGFERLVVAIQGKESNYDTDVFQPLIAVLEKKSGKKYGQDEKTDIAMRVIADHVRAISFAIADGELPSNNKGGYVIKRILRRAVRYGYTFLGFKEAFLYQLLPVLADQFADVFPEIKSQFSFIEKAIQEEEKAFLRTLENGLKLFEQIKSETKGDTIDGKVVFKLYDTFGFPLDLTELIARENNLKIDLKGFEAAMAIQKSSSRKAAQSEKSDWISVLEGGESEFVGYEQQEATVKILRYRQVSEKKHTYYQIVLDKTPFYAEAGGQVGDTGVLQFSGSEKSIKIIDTKKENDLSIHISNQKNFLELIEEIKANNTKLLAKIDLKKRKLTENNHSATHLLQKALQNVLGSHLAQKGSLVNDKGLRFDFSHFQKMTDEEIEAVEREVNQAIRKNIQLKELRNTPIQEAKDMGAMALFGEKYGDNVRVIVFDEEYSVELCGGTHVSATGNIGSFKIISETSIASGVRRIEAITAEAAEAYGREESKTLQTVKTLLKNPKNVEKGIETLLKQNAELSKQVEAMQAQAAQNLKAELLNDLQANGTSELNFLAKKVNLSSAAQLKNICFELKNQVENLFLVLAANINDKPQIAVMISETLVKNKDLNAGKIVRELAKEIKGGGGGQAFFATAGGKDINGLDNAVAKAKELV